MRKGIFLVVGLMVFPIMGYINGDFGQGSIFKKVENNYSLIKSTATRYS